MKKSNQYYQFMSTIIELHLTECRRLQALPVSDREERTLYQSLISQIEHSTADRITSLIIIAMYLVSSLCSSSEDKQLLPDGLLKAMKGVEEQRRIEGILSKYDDAISFSKASGGIHDDLNRWKRKPSRNQEQGKLRCIISYRQRVDLLYGLKLLNSSSRHALLELAHFRNQAMHDVHLLCQYQLTRDDPNETGESLAVSAPGYFQIHSSLPSSSSTHGSDIPAILRQLVADSSTLLENHDFNISLHRLASAIEKLPSTTIAEHAARCKQRYEEQPWRSNIEHIGVQFCKLIEKANAEQESL